MGDDAEWADEMERMAINRRVYLSDSLEGPKWVAMSDKDALRAIETIRLLRCNYADRPFFKGVCTGVGG